MRNEAAAQLGESPSDIAEADDADGLAEDLAADEVEAPCEPAGAQGAVSLANALGQAEHHASTCSATPRSCRPTG
jgi:hypothetical protein